jgi:hypothetical protein
MPKIWLLTDNRGNRTLSSLNYNEDDVIYVN